MCGVKLMDRINIEELMAKLGLEESLHRQYAVVRKGCEERRRECSVEGSTI